MALKQMDSPSEEAGLVRSAREGSREDFDLLIASILPGLRVAARRLAGQEAEDLVQECLSAASLGIRGLQEPAAWRGWIYQILVRRNIDRIRRRRRDETGSGEPIDSADPLSRLLEGESREQARQALESLEERLKIPLTLRYHQDLSNQEIADRTGRPLGTVKSLIHEGLRAFERAVREKLS